MKSPALAVALVLALVLVGVGLKGPLLGADAGSAPRTTGDTKTGDTKTDDKKPGDEKAEDREAPDPNAEPTPEEAAKEAVSLERARVAATRPSPNTRPAAKPVARPIEGIKRVLVISIDGMRPDLLLLADAPFSRKLLKRGSYSMWAQTTPQSITLPSHVSMLSGVTPNRHGILWNSDLPLDYPLYPSTPTLFEEAKKRGYSTAVAAGKDKFDLFDRPGVLDWKWIPRKGTVKTPLVTKAAVEIIKNHKPEVMLVHLPSVDSVGHNKGWASPEQMVAIAEADDALSQVFSALESAGVADSTLVIISADHGGRGKGHTSEDNRSRHIPWIAVNPNIRQNFDLTSESKLNIRTEDTFATACWVLGIPPTNKDLDGAPVTFIQPRSSKSGEELLKPATPAAKK